MNDRPTKQVATTDDAVEGESISVGKLFLHEPAYTSVLDWARDQDKIIEHNPAKRA